MTRTQKSGGLIKAATGVRGFDDITGGGLPAERTTLILGNSGSGKTIFALQTLLTGARNDEPGILVTFQESPRQLIENAATLGWDLAGMEKEKLVILDARIRPTVFKAMDMYLAGMLAGIRVVANEMRAKRIVFDSIDILLALLGDRMTERHEIFRLRDWLLESGLTAVITAQVENEAALISQRLGFMQFTADCVVNLNHQMATPEAVRTLRVAKYRGSGFVEREFPFVISQAGLEMTGLEVDGREPEKPLENLQQEIARTQIDFKARIQELNRRLEIKQAELDFLTRDKAKKENKVANERQRPLDKGAGDRPKTRKTGNPARRRRMTAGNGASVLKKG